MVGEYEIRPRKDRDGFDLISDRLRYGPIWFAGSDAVRCAVAYAKYRSPSHRAVIRVFNEGPVRISPHALRACVAAVVETVDAMLTL
jgi:hypothetical protein